MYFVISASTSENYWIKNGIFLTNLTIMAKEQHAKKAEKKKPEKNLKEKRADKKAKQEEKKKRD